MKQVTDLKGRPVPQWMVDRNMTPQEMTEAMDLREAAFPKTKANAEQDSY